MLATVLLTIVRSLAPLVCPDRQTEGSPRRRAVGIDLVVTGCVLVR